MKSNSSSNSKDLCSSLEYAKNFVCFVAKTGEILYLNHVGREILNFTHLPSQTSTQVQTPTTPKEIFTYFETDKKTAIEANDFQTILNSTSPFKWVSKENVGDQRAQINLRSLEIAISSSQKVFVLIGEIDSRTLEVLHSRKNHGMWSDLGMSSEFLKSVLENIPNMIFLKDGEDLKFVFVNKACEDLTGFSGNDLLGKNDRDFFPKDQAEFFISKDREVLDGGKPIDIGEESILTKSKGLKYLHTKKVPLKGPNGKSFLVGISEDITARRKAEAELRSFQKELEGRVEERTKEIQSANSKLEAEAERSKKFVKALEESESQLRLVTNALPMLVGYISKDLTYTFVNSYYEKWFNKKSFEIIGSHIKDILGSNQYEKLLPHLQKVLAGQTVEVRLSSTDQLERAKELMITLIPDISPTKEIRGCIEITQDITDRIRQDGERNRLLASEQAAMEASRMKSQFLANMSHEIRTPINGVIGMTGLLLGTSLTTDQKDYAESVKRSADALLTVINDILDFSKVEAGKLEIEEIPFDLISTFQDLQKSFSYTLKGRPVAFDLEIDPKIPLFVKGDPGRLRQVASNLLSNAIKFTKQGRVLIRLINAEENQGNVSIECQVQDTGIGISQSKLEKLFTPFHQADPSVYREYGGSGLGLSISKRLVQLMGGEIGAKSEEGKGSLFWFRVRFPKVTVVETAEQTREEEIDPNEARNYRILVAEDNSINQKLAVRTLEGFGFVVDAVANGKEVIESLKTVPYDLILMDCQMPEMDGFEATSTIRKDPNLPNHIPIIATTANAMKGDNERCIEAGMDDYVSKPIAKKRLAGILLKWMKRWATQKKKNKLRAS